MAEHEWTIDEPRDDAVAVIGAGIVGLCAALGLARAGRRVTVFDPQPPGSGASYGNAGALSVDANAPIAGPGVLAQAPRWLLDPLGPLTLRPGYALRAAPWLIRFARAGRMDRVSAAADALRALNRNSYDDYEALLGAGAFADLIRRTGSVQIFDNDVEGAGEAVARGLRDRHGIETRALTAGELRDLFPGLAPAVRRGLLFPRNGQFVNLPRLAATLAWAFLAAGGTVRRERVLELRRRERSFALLTDTAQHECGVVVVAAGAWSNSVLRSLGIKLPLESERGYHVVIEQPTVALAMPLFHRGRGVAMTSLEDGLRVAGTVEFAGLEAAADARRARNLRHQAQILFPTLTGARERTWMGHRPSLPDSVPAIGPVPGRPGLFLALGHGHYGMIGAATTSRLITALVVAGPPPIDPAPYSPARFVRA